MKFDKEIEQLINKWRKVLEEQLKLPENKDGMEELSTWKYPGSAV